MLIYLIIASITILFAYIQIALLGYEMWKEGKDKMFQSKSKQLQRRLFKILLLQVN
jgi:hypothetical protein